MLERDHLLSWVLAGISQISELRQTLVFKVGTALKKCYFGDYRFSEDLDFSCLADVPKGEAMDWRSLEMVAKEPGWLLLWSIKRINEGVFKALESVRNRASVRRQNPPGPPPAFPEPRGRIPAFAGMTGWWLLYPSFQKSRTTSTRSS